jgi:hypothetical protein
VRHVNLKRDTKRICNGRIYSTSRMGYKLKLYSNGKTKDGSNLPGSQPFVFHGYHYTTQYLLPGSTDHHKSSNKSAEPLFPTSRSLTTFDFFPFFFAFFSVASCSVLAF